MTHPNILKASAVLEVTRYRTSDNREHTSAEDARVHELYLALNRIIPEGANTRYSAICQLLRRFDLVPRDPVNLPSAEDLARDSRLGQHNDIPGAKWGK